MARIRITLFLVALAVGIPVALLAWRALDGLAVQRAVRHQVVAERAFDEMERVLSGFLEREEERPFEHYAFYLADGARSPLAGPAPDDFVVGAFQIDPDGSVHTPLEPRDRSAASGRGDWPPPAEVSAAIARVTGVVSAAWRPGGEFVNAERAGLGGSFAASADPRRQAPGTTRAVDGGAEAKLEAQARRDASQRSAYEVLQSFNRGVEQREERRKQQADTPARKALDKKRSGGKGDTVEGGEAYAGTGLELEKERMPRANAPSPDVPHMDDRIAPALAAPRAAPAPEPRASVAGAPESRASVAGAPESRASVAGAPESRASVAGAPESRASVAGAPESRASVAGAPESRARIAGVRQPMQEARPRAARAPMVQAESAPPPQVAEADALSSLGYLADEELAPSEWADDAPALEAAVDEREQPSEPLPADAISVDALEKDADADAVVEPMLGRAVDARHLLLYRTVLLGSRGYRQGLVLDRERLGGWLTDRVIAPSGLAGAARVRFAATGTELPAAGGAYGFEHRFAEPFDALSARLELAALPGVGSPGAVYGLVAVVVGVGLLGLLAVHRSVSLTVDFAERRSNFVAAVTHELKTPLTAIRMYAEMLRDGLVGNEAKRSEYYGTITDESERLTRLIDNVLEFSRLERGQREMSFSVGSPAPVLEEAAEKLRTHVEREGFGIELEVEPDLPPVRYDRDALLQVIYNLVDNAMKYGRSAHSKTVVLEARRRDDGVEVSVRDFGPGVSARHAKRIFEPFYRGADELTRTAKGTGIGLALVKELAERMGAAVSGANASGGGFRVRLAFRAAGGVV